MSTKRTEIVIAVMGATGTGKSSFVRLLTGNEDILIGHSLKSETNKVSTYKLSLENYDFVIADTPGFDDTYISDRDVLRTLSSWLEMTYRDGEKLTGIIYLHRISDPRIQGSALRNLYMFRKLCGENAFKNIILGTTFWDTLVTEPEIGEQRETELIEQDELWGCMVKRGSEVIRIPAEAQAAQDILVKMATKKSVALELQKELVDQGKFLDETLASKILVGLKALVEKHERQLKAEEERHRNELQEREEHSRRKAEAQRESYEAQLREKEAARAAQQAEFDRAMEEMNIQLETLKKERERMSQQSEGEVEDLSKNDPMAIRTSKREAFRRDIKKSIETIDNERKRGMIVCTLLPLNPAYVRACDNCFRTIGSGSYYTCPYCYDGDFHLCLACYRSEGIYCNVRDHHSFLSKNFESNNGKFCHRVARPPQSDPLLCKKCKQDVGISYLHCCVCSGDDFDLCLPCVIKGRKCNKFASSSGHPMNLCFRFLPSVTSSRPQAPRSGGSRASIDSLSPMTPTSFPSPTNWNHFGAVNELLTPDMGASDLNRRPRSTSLQPSPSPRVPSAQRQPSVKPAQLSDDQDNREAQLPAEPPPPYTPSIDQKSPLSTNKMSPPPLPPRPKPDSDLFRNQTN